jgi:dolichol-phosphate mannosyltransferase
LQDPPELILELFEEWTKGKKVVGAIAENKHNSYVQHILRNIFYKILLSSSGQKLIPNFQDFYLLDKSVYTEIAKRNEQFQFIRGVISAEFGIDKVVTYKRAMRIAGESKFRLLDKYDLAMDGLLVFGSRFIRALAVTSFMISAVTFLSLAVYLVLKILGVDYGVPGWATLVALVLLVLGIMLAFFSIAFEFLYRILRLLVKK